MRLWLQHVFCWIGYFFQAGCISWLVCPTLITNRRQHSQSSVCMISWCEKVHLHFLYLPMQMSSDSAFQTCIKRDFGFSFMSDNIPLPGWPCCLQSECTVLKLEGNLECVFKKWQRWKEIRMSVSSNIFYCNFFCMRVVLFLDILYLYILVCEVILMKGNFSSCVKKNSLSKRGKG